MTRLLLLRHGQSENNLSNRSSGQYDTPLTALGVEQARIACQYVLSAYAVDAIWSSDLSRARDTVTPVARALGMEIKTSPLLREVDVGIFANVYYPEVRTRWASEYTEWIQYRAAAPGGESFADLGARADRILRRIARECEGKTVLVGTHAGLIRAMLTLIEYGEISQKMDLVKIPNASLTCLDWDGESFSVSVRGFCDYTSFSAAKKEDSACL